MTPKLSRMMSVLPLLVLETWGTTAFSASVAPDLPSRELRQMQDDWHRERNREEMNGLPNKSTTAEMPGQAPAQMPSSEFMFDVRSIGHTGSLVLTDEEFDSAVAPWIGKRIKAVEIADILNAVNAKYREKGYVVCQAVVKPQRVRDGHLQITLLEGRTESVTVKGNTSTNESFITGAFDFKVGEIANYRDMIDALVRFNMTNDVSLRIDIGAGQTPMSTAYRIFAEEPDRWGGGVFADTTGSKSTGRPRIGMSVTNRSLFGRRDALNLLGLVSRGSKSAMAGYSMPLTSFGTRLSGTVSYGKVEVIDGPSKDFDVEGESFMAALRLEHPVYVTDRSKFTVWTDVSRQTSNSEMFGGVRVADTAIRAYSLGLDSYLLYGHTTAVGSAVLTKHQVDERLFNKQTGYTMFTGNLAARHRFENGFSLTLNGRWQAVTGGDALNSADYFYLGHSGGVRGYDNDILCAESGGTASLEAAYPIAGELTSLYAFFDAGRLTGKRISDERSLYSAGLGIVWPLFPGANLNVAAAFPLKRDLADEINVNRARFDLSVVIAW